MQVLAAFSIDTSALGLLSRCAKCNGEFELRYALLRLSTGCQLLELHPRQGLSQCSPSAMLIHLFVSRLVWSWTLQRGFLEVTMHDGEI